MAKKIVFTGEDDELEVYMGDDSLVHINVGSDEKQYWGQIALGKNDVSELIKALNEFVEKMA